MDHKQGDLAGTSTSLHRYVLFCAPVLPSFGDWWFLHLIFAGFHVVFVPLRDRRCGLVIAFFPLGDARISLLVRDFLQTHFFVVRYNIL